ncbi:MAG: virulence factor [Nitratireductor sp.]|nr:virulence factor [Nitratireductor sp.]
MAQLTIVYWRDIPAQVIVKIGRKSAKRELPLRFAEAIDMCAMRVGASDTDAYLAEWRRGEPMEVGDDLEAEADKAMAELDARFPKDELVALVAAEGRLKAAE